MGREDEVEAELFQVRMQIEALMFARTNGQWVSEEDRRLYVALCRREAHLLEGPEMAVIEDVEPVTVASAPASPRHQTILWRAFDALKRTFGLPKGGGRIAVLFGLGLVGIRRSLRAPQVAFRHGAALATKSTLLASPVTAVSTVLAGTVTTLSVLAGSGGPTPNTTPPAPVAGSTANTGVATPTLTSTAWTIQVAPPAITVPAASGAVATPPASSSSPTSAQAVLDPNTPAPSPADTQPTGPTSGSVPASSTSAPGDASLPVLTVLASPTVLAAPISGVEDAATGVEDTVNAAEEAVNGVTNAVTSEAPAGTSPVAGAISQVTAAVPVASGPGTPTGSAASPLAGASGVVQGVVNALIPTS